MKTQLYTLCLFLFVCFANAQTFVPMPCTGYNIDGVAENTTAVSTTGGALDASDFVLYSQFYGTYYAGGTVGLPNNGLIASGTRTYQLATYTGSNVLHLFANGVDTLVFTNQQAFPVISLLCYGTQGNATASVTVRFSDNSTQVFNPLTLTDWFSVVSPVYAGFDRVLRTTGTPALVGSAGNPRMMGLDLSIACANQGKTISKIIIRNTSASAHVCVMGVSGAIPAYSVSGNQLICAGNTSSLVASGFSTYTWQPSGSFAGSNASSITVSPTSNSTYTLLGTDATGCPGYTTITVTVSNQSPTLSLAGSTQSICLGAAATITASGALSYTLSSPAANGASFAPLATAVYTVSGSNGCGTASLTTSITVTPLSISASASNTLVCSGTTTTLTPLGATNYTWMPGNSTQTVFTPAPLANTIYTLSGKTASCYATTTIAIATNPLPTLAVVATSSDICAGESVTLTVNGNAQSYTWTPGGSNSYSIVVTPGSNTLIGVSGTNLFNCDNSAQQAIVVKSLPVISLSASKYTVCAGAPSTITAGGATSYTWSNGSNGNSTVFSPLVTQTCGIAGTGANGCVGYNTTILTAISPTFSVNGTASICPGQTATLTASGATSYTWINNGFTFPQFTSTLSATTIFTVNATVNYTPASLPCIASKTTQVTVFPSTSVTTSGTRTTICKGEKTVLTASVAGGSGSFVWSIGNTTLSSSSATVNPSNTTTYNVVGTDANGCSGNGQIQVKVNACLSVAELNQDVKPFEIYPNPASVQLQVRSIMCKNLQITNSIGQVVKKLNVENQNTIVVDISDLPDGIYFIGDADNSAGKVQRFVKTN